MVDPLQTARRLRAIITADEESALEVRFREWQQSMWRRVAATMPDMSIGAVMERWAQEISKLPRAEQLRAAQLKLALLEGLGYAEASVLVRAALRRAEALGEESLSTAGYARSSRKCPGVR